MSSALRGAAPERCRVIHTWVADVELRAGSEPDVREVLLGLFVLNLGEARGKDDINKRPILSLQCLCWTTQMNG